MIPDPGSPNVDAIVFDESGKPPILLRKGVVAGLVVAFVIFVAGYLILAKMLGLSNSIEAEPFREWVDDQGALGPIAYMLVLALSVLIAPIPNVPIFIAAGLAWGPVVGTVYSMGGMMLGSTMAFYVSRYIGQRHLPKLIGVSAARRLDRLVEAMGGRMVFWARMIPVINFDWVSFVAGLTSIRFTTFFIYSFFGMLTPTTIAVIAGDSLGKDVRITLALGGLWVAAIVVSAIVFWMRRDHVRSRLA